MSKTRGIHFKEWECYKLGMYKNSPTNNAEKITIDFFNDFDKFQQYCDKVLIEFKNSRIHHVKIIKTNPISWLGQCANCLCNGVSEWETRKYWKYLDNKTMQKCNKIAKDAIQKFMLGSN